MRQHDKLVGFQAMVLLWMVCPRNNGSPPEVFFCEREQGGLLVWVIQKVRRVFPQQNVVCDLSQGRVSTII